MTKVSARRNKQRGKETERAIAAMFEGIRLPADTGGPIDVIGGEGGAYAIQCKGGLKLLNATVKGAVDSARTGAKSTQLPMAVLEDRSGSRLRYYVVMDARDFLAWEGVGSG